MRYNPIVKKSFAEGKWRFVNQKNKRNIFTLAMSLAFSLISLFTIDPIKKIPWINQRLDGSFSDWALQAIVFFVITILLFFSLKLFSFLKGMAFSINNCDLLLELQKAGIKKVCFSHQDLKMNGFSMRSYSENVKENSHVVVFSRTARQFGEAHEAIKKALANNVRFSFFLPDPGLQSLESTDHDKERKNHLLETLWHFKNNFISEINFSVYFVNFYTAHSFVLIDEIDNKRVALDVFLDNTPEDRPTIIFDDKESGEIFTQYFAKMVTFHQGRATKVDLKNFDKTKYQKNEGSSNQGECK